MRWPLSDIIDFEYFLTREANGKSSDIPSGVRELGEKGVIDRKQVFAAWLAAKRVEAGGSTPGRTVEKGFKLAIWLAAIFGLVAGLSLCWGLLFHDRKSPVDIVLFLLQTLGIQFLFLMIAVCAAFFIARSGSFGFRLFEWVRFIWNEIALKLGTQLDHLPGRKRSAIKETLSSMESRHDLYGHILIWPTVIAAQLFMVFFNLGLILVLQLGWTTPVVFAWGSSSSRSTPEGVHRVASIFATPWSWLPEAQPDLLQVAKTKFLGKTDVTESNVEAGTAWWPFMAYAIGIYGLLPRIALLAWARFRDRKERSALQFSHPACNELYRELRGELIKPGPPGSKLRPLVEKQAGSLPRDGSCWVLLADGIAADETEIKEMIHASYGWVVDSILLLKIDNPLGNQDTLDSLRKAAGIVGVAVVVAAKRAPIVAIARTLTYVRDAILQTGVKELTLLLVGRNGNPVEDEYFNNWKQFGSIHKLAFSFERIKS